MLAETTKLTLADQVSAGYGCLSGVQCPTADVARPLFTGLRRLLKRDRTELRNERRRLRRRQQNGTRR
jgi:hypothetical protein